MASTRRQFVTSALGLLSLSATNSTWASSNIALGKTKIDVVSDGNLQLPGAFAFAGMPEAELKEILPRYGLSMSGITPDCNLTLVRDGERVILFDVGAGPNFMDSAGKLTDALSAIDVNPADVTDVVFTHGHPDHLWGLQDDFDDLLFSDATYHMAQEEFDYWMSPNTVDTIGEARQAFAAGAMRNLKAIEERVVQFKSGTEILPGVLARGTPGHTPGHTSFEIRAGGKSVLVVGDAIGNHHVAFEKPAWETNSDQNKTLGAKSRVSLLDQLSSQKTKLIGFHLPHPGIGFVEKKGTAYRWVAA